MHAVLNGFWAFVAFVAFVWTTYGSWTNAQQPNTATNNITGKNCSRDQFRCESGECIAKAWQCDGDPDCKDSSDEPSNCKPNVCDPTREFLCKYTLLCIQRAFVCDHEPDCGSYAANNTMMIDRSDEENCSTGVQCSFNELQCSDRKTCIHIQQFCDGKVDCPGAYDEGWFCYADNLTCATATTSGCDYGCKRVESGIKCFCSAGNTYDEKQKKCVDANECLLENSCQQMCTNTPSGSFTCACVSGYEQVQGMPKFCDAVNKSAGNFTDASVGASVLLATKRDILRMRLDFMEDAVNSKTDVMHGFDIRGMDFDYRLGEVCWVDNVVDPATKQRGKIVLACAPVSNLSRVTVKDDSEFSLEGVNYIAKDYIANNWYFLDEVYDRLFACTSNLSICQLILHDTLDKPKEIALDPLVGYVFICDWSSLQPQMIRVNMDGTNRRNIVASRIVYPYGITLDFVRRRVYWVDHYLEFIFSSDYDGTERHVIADGRPVKNLFALAEFERYIYATDHIDLGVLRIGKLNSTDQKHWRLTHKVQMIKVYHAVKQPFGKVDHPCAKDNGNCSHMCLTAYITETINGTVDFVPVAKCVCKAGYKLDRTDNRSCDIAFETPFLLFGKTRPGTIAGVPLTPTAGYEVIRPISNLRRPTAVAIHVQQQEVYYADSSDYTISKQRVNASNAVKKTVIDRGISNCEGLAIDWVANNLYWSDEGLLQISVARLGQPLYNRTIAQGNMTHPRAVAVAPVDGYVFFTDWSEIVQGLGSSHAKIERANTDGSNRTAIVWRDIHWPNGLTIDFRSKLLYWGDAFLDVIEASDFEGNRKFSYKSEFISHPYGLAFFENFLYWCELRQGKIYRLNLIDGNQTELVHTDSSPLFEIHVFHDSVQNGSNSCADGNGGCEHFCFFIEGSVRCNCSFGYEVSLDDPRKCIVGNVTSGNRHCTSLEFECRKNLRCIDRKYLCDGDNDCGDNSDEDASKPNGACAHHTCEEQQFSCGNNRCIPLSWQCDGDNDCRNGDDELNCSSSGCSSNLFQCKESKRCIVYEWKCDGEADCGSGDKSDEENCQFPVCEALRFECQNHQCVPQTFVCDGDKDCRDGSDELACDQNCVSGEEVYCQATKTCLGVLFVCDGHADCPDGSDERGCKTHEANPNCLTGQFSCGDDVCIRGSFRCDGDSDCVDGSDEFNCTTDYFTCSSGRVPCHDGSKCLLASFVCDGDVDCRDGSDELNCTYAHEAACVFPNWHCAPNSQGEALCLSPSKLCDDNKDCPGGDDEGLLCDQDYCGRNISACYSAEYCYNTPQGSICDCPQGYRLQPNGRTCNKSDPCKVWGVCSQHCQSHGLHYKCYCEADYFLAEDKFSCISTATVKPYLIFSNRHELRLVGLQSDVTASLATGLRNTIAIDYYLHHQSSYFRKSQEADRGGSTTTAENTTDVVATLFWTDIAADKIYSATLTNQALSNAGVVIDTGVATAEGIAVDWVTQKLYWVDSTLDHIEVASFDGSLRAEVISGNMQNLRAITLDPGEGLLFWSDWEDSKPRIERCTMAGFDRQEIVVVSMNSEMGGWPNGLTADYIAKRLYWIDAKSDSIHSVYYNGSDSRTILKRHDFLSHPFAISVFESKIYWTDWRVNSVIRANKWNGSDVQIVHGTTAQPFDIAIVHPSRQPPNTKNTRCSKPDQNGQSSLCGGALCLLNGRFNYSCKCPYLKREVITANRTQFACEDVQELLIVALDQMIIGVDVRAPYQNVMPVLTAGAENVSSLEVDIGQKLVYWTDTKMGAIYRANLNGSGQQVVLDTDLANPGNLAVDWLSGNMYFTSHDQQGKSRISVSTLNGTYRVDLVTDVVQPMGLVVHPARGIMYWLDAGDKTNGPRIMQSYMDGNKESKRALVQDVIALSQATGLRLDYASNRLYWVSQASHKIYWADTFAPGVAKPVEVPLTTGMLPARIAIAGNALYIWEYDGSTINRLQMVVLNDSLQQPVLMRNLTTMVKQLKLFDPRSQSGTNDCSASVKPCDQLCLPIPTSHSCSCTTGYALKIDNATCEGRDKFLFYIVKQERTKTSRLYGFTVEASFEQILAPISFVHTPLSVAHYAADDLLLWADAYSNQVVSIRRELTSRTIIMQDRSFQVYSIAVDGVAGNVYMAKKPADTSKEGVIEVARIDGSYPLVVRAMSDDLPFHLQVDSQKGYLFYVAGRGIHRVLLNGTAPGGDSGIIVNDSKVVDFTLWRQAERACWLSATNRSIVNCVDYDGLKKPLVFRVDASVTYDALTIDDEQLFLYSKTNKDAPLVVSRLKDDETIVNLDVDVTLPLNFMPDNGTLVDMVLFHRGLSMESNLCGKENGGCEHLCFYLGNDQRQCQCSYGFVNSDGQCEKHKTFLMYSTVQSIETAFLDIELNMNKPFPPYTQETNAPFIKNVVGLAFDYANDRIFYSDIQLGDILSVHVKKTDFQVVARGQGSVEGLAYDYVHGDLYWTSYSNSSISRANVGPNEKFPVERTLVLVQLSAGDRPRGLVVDGCDKRMYWSNWNENKPCIQRSLLSGQVVQTIVDTGIVTPNALTLDFAARKLYWADARLDKIERCNLDGSQRVVVTRDKRPTHAFGLAVYGDSLYWTDWIMRAVVRVNKYTGGEFSVVQGNFPRQPMAIVVVANDSMLCDRSACNIDNGGCMDICNLDERGVPSCACASARRPVTSDRRICRDRKSECNTTSQFECANGRCIAIEATCDGHADCQHKNSDDENPIYCATRQCPVGFFNCSNSACVSQTKRCNGLNDCGDMSDEAGCDCTTMVGPRSFRCKNGRCLAPGKRCDQHPDCGNIGIGTDASDETNCTFFELGNRTMKDVCAIHGASFVPCPYTTQCILPRWRCDGSNDCWDNADEANCSRFEPFKPLACSQNMFRCGPHGRCIPRTWVCDHASDCPGGEDEIGCDFAKVACASNEFKCEDGVCMSESWRCDGVRDCTDGSDEKACERTPTCKDAEFRCDDGRCIPRAWLCDGRADCDGTEDEHNSTRTGCTPPTCLPDHFQCNNGQCIPHAFYCDRDDDCGDHSDEPSGCTHAICTNDQFRCATNGSCIPSSWVCNEMDDCLDGSDEAVELCKGVIPENPCEDGEFMCTNKACVNETLLCDQQNDCGDYSDEDSCDINECETEKPCQQVCIDKTIGYECMCGAGYTLTADKKSCYDVDECVTSYPCTQVCANKPGSFECSCVLGYMLQADGRTCTVDVSDGHEPEPARILVAEAHTIHMYSLSGRSIAHVTSNLSNVVAVDYDWKERKIYWSDATPSGGRLGRCDFDGKNMEILHEAHVGTVDGIAVDWVARNLYWCDRVRDTIEVSRLDGRYRKTLLRASSNEQHNLEEPRGLAIDPIRRFLFYSDWGEAAHIGRMALNGSDASYIVQTSLIWPNALTVDLTSQRLFWGDAHLDYIGMCAYDGSLVRVVPIKRSHLPHVFSIGIFEENIIWTDWERRGLYIAHKFQPKTDEVKQIVQGFVQKPMGLRIMHEVLQPDVPSFENPCFKNGWCKNLCLPSPSPGRGYSCGCPDSFKPKGLLECEANCTTSEFACNSSYKCIPFWWRCDNQTDCSKDEDEPESCPRFNCSPGQFQCDDGNCTQPSDICNGVDNCPDGSDERNCGMFTCLYYQFTCNGEKPKCILRSQMCDGRRDCEGGEDEINCDNVLPSGACNIGHFQCPAGGPCIPAEWLCDQEVDCPHGGVDEANCKRKAVKCAPYTFRCDNATAGYARCIADVHVCDGRADCLDMTDEAASMCRNRTCNELQFKCPGGRCIPLSWKCDSAPDCPVKAGVATVAADEVDCDSAHQKNCTSSEWQCANKRCISQRFYCDGDEDCSDGSDEPANCSGASLHCTSPFEWPCTDRSRCIHVHMKCNGIQDCNDGSDESPECAASAGNQTCAPHQFRCTSSGQCIAGNWRCDGDRDCLDGSDELITMCGPKVRQCPLPEDYYMCVDAQTCIPRSFQCDGEVDCVTSGEDESPNVCSTNVTCAVGYVRCASRDQCVPQSRWCDGVTHCRDGSDEIQRSAAGLNTIIASTNTRKCPGRKFVCRNGHEVDPKSQCDDYDDCGDRSDELDCETSVCARYGTCPQRCQVTRQGLVKCLCDYGYTEEWMYSFKCRAMGPPAVVAIGLHSEIKTIDALAGRHYESVEQFGYKIHAMDFAFYPNDSVSLFWVGQDDMLPHPLGGRGLFRRTVPWSLLNGSMSDDRRYKRADSPWQQKRPLVETLVTNMSTPQDITVDWIHQVVYWTDSHRRTVEFADFTGKIRAIVVAANLEHPSAVAVSPEVGYLFFTDLGRVPKVERTNLDGSERKVLVNSDIIWPIDLAIDHANQRLYWTDPKASVIETVNFEGRDRRVVRSFAYGEPKPMYLDVFEDWIYYVTYGNQTSVKRVHKFANYSNGLFANSDVVHLSSVQKTAAANPHVQRVHDLIQRVLSRGQTRSGETVYTPMLPFATPNLVLIQQFKQNAKIATPCVPRNPCSPNSVCLSVRWHSYQCFCAQPRVFNRTTRTCEVELQSFLTPDKVCSPGCRNNASCVWDDVEGRFTCQCLDGYSGQFCENDLCHGLCTNGGTCKRFAGGAECDCPSSFSGFRCEHFKCSHFCDLEHGQCYIEQNTTQPRCRCFLAWSGPHCESLETCQEYCHNRGSCRHFGGRPYCSCTGGFQGSRCEDCPDFSCFHGGVCRSDGKFCTCTPRFDGYRCERDKCMGYCAPGGRCVEQLKNLTCECYLGFGGDRCDVDLCRNHCLNGGTCTVLEGKDVRCLCPPGFSGARCEQRLSCETYCKNSGACREDGTCACSKGWRGERCDVWWRCENYCLNGGTCNMTELGMPWCVCPRGLGSPLCSKITAQTCGGMQCVNGGVCDRAKCICPLGWKGLLCTEASCSGYCHAHGSSCTIIQNVPVCTCPSGIFGARCDVIFPDFNTAESQAAYSTMVAAIVVPLILVIVIGIFIFYLVFVRKQARLLSQFKPRRLMDDDATENPAFLAGNEELDTYAEDVVNFTNPMYESVYNDTVTSEERGGLLPARPPRLEMFSDDID